MGRPTYVMAIIRSISAYKVDTMSENWITGHWSLSTVLAVACTVPHQRCCRGQAYSLIVRSQSHHKSQLRPLTALYIHVYASRNVPSRTMAGNGPCCGGYLVAIWWLSGGAHCSVAAGWTEGNSIFVMVTAPRETRGPVAGARGNWASSGGRVRGSPGEDWLTMERWQWVDVGRPVDEHRDGVTPSQGVLSFRRTGVLGSNKVQSGPYNPRNWL